MTTKDCRACGTTFEIARGGPHEIARRTYCSRPCAGRRGPAPDLTPKECLQCSRQFTKPRGCSVEEWPKRRFCSNSCWGIFRKNETRGRLIEDVSWIVDHDNPHSVAKRVGYGRVEDLINKLSRIGQPELAEKLVRGVERWRVEVPA